MPKLIDLIGQKFGRLKVIRRVDNNNWGSSRWLCQCDCKNENPKASTKRELIMNKTNIRTLLTQWSELIDSGKQISIERASSSLSGLRGRIKRVTGKPVIFDFRTYEKQKTIQDSLCKEMPRFTDLIRSIPEIMDGHSWIKEDFIELYFEHFLLVVQKLQRITDRETPV